MLARTLAGWGRYLGLRKPEPPAEDERRLWGRLACDVATKCKPTRQRDAAELPARVKNVSMAGACLHLPVPLPLGELLRVSLPGPVGEDSSEILACVVRCEAVSGSTFEVGCTFATPLRGEDMRQFDTPRCERPPDRRFWERFPTQARAAYQLIRNPELTGLQPAAIMNISGGGVALRPERPVEIGELLSIHLSHGEDHVVTALGSVVRCTQGAGHLEIGCNFIRELPEELLARLMS